MFLPQRRNPNPSATDWRLNRSYDTNLSPYKVREAVSFFTLHKILPRRFWAKSSIIVNSKTKYFKILLSQIKKTLTNEIQWTIM
ncbi:MAG TPA: hypothetical protein DEV98_02985 [Clostridiales bacterium]|nr:hypothetical protein [Clostridiales bacterium]